MLDSFKNIEDIFTKFNGPIYLAAALNLHQWTVERWRKTGIPQKYWNFLIKKVDITPGELLSINNRIKNRSKS